MSVAESNLGQADCYLQVCECVCVSVSYLQEIPNTILQCVTLLFCFNHHFGNNVSYNLTAKFVFVSQNCGRSAFGIFHMCVI